MIPPALSRWFWNHVPELIGASALLLLLVLVSPWIALAWRFLSSLARSL